MIRYRLLFVLSVYEGTDRLVSGFTALQAGTAFSRRTGSGLHQSVCPVVSDCTGTSVRCTSRMFFSAWRRGSMT